MRQFSAIAARTANSTTLRFSTGRAPGRPRQTGQTFVLGGAPKRAEHEQKILVRVKSWTCTSSPITGSYLARAATGVSDVVTIINDYKRPPVRGGDQEWDRGGIIWAWPVRSDTFPTGLQNTSVRSPWHRARPSNRSVLPPT